jgi:glycosyltransferase involved in cell wall biosynthesis
VDEEQDPASIEHFGIATVEVMRSGVIPVGLNRGGSLSIIEHGKSGFLADSKEDVVAHTVKLMEADIEELRHLQVSGHGSGTQRHWWAP